jgi:UDP-glucose 6-dehydrogenase
MTSEPGTVAVLGLAFKPGVSVPTESQGIELLSELAGEYELVGYDALGAEQARELLDDERICYTDSLSTALAQADTAVVTLQDASLTNPSWLDSIRGTVIDPWRIFTPEEVPDDVTYVPLGRRDFQKQSPESGGSAGRSP